MKLRYASFAVFLLCLPLAAQTTKTKDHKAAAVKTAEAAPSGAPKPAPEMEKLSKVFLGRWSVSVEMAATNFGPADKGHGTQTSKPGPGGFSVVSDDTMKFEKSGPFAGHGVTYYDPAAKAYGGFWCDSWSPTCMQIGTGNWDGENIVINGSMDYEGHTIKLRHTYSDITGHSYKYTLEMEDQSGSMKPWMTFTYTKLMASARQPASSPKK